MAKANDDENGSQFLKTSSPFSAAFTPVYRSQNAA
jgi:hypothetical protein